MKRIPFEDLQFTDHFMFEKVLMDEEICRELLERLLKIKVTKVVYHDIEKVIEPYYESRGIRLDVYVKDSDKVYDIELQNTKVPDLGKRCRYYQSMLDVDNLIKNQDYSELPQSFIIFICTFDPFAKKLPIYTLKIFCEEDKAIELKNDAVIKIFNTKNYAAEKDVDICNFLEYIELGKPADNFTTKIDSTIAKIKQQESFKREYAMRHPYITDIRREAIEEGIQQGLEQGLQQGITQGAEQTRIETAKNFLKMGFSIEQIAQGTGLSLEQVKQIQNSVIK